MYATVRRLRRTRAGEPDTWVQRGPTRNTPVTRMQRQNNIHTGASHHVNTKSGPSQLGAALVGQINNVRDSSRASSHTTELRPARSHPHVTIFFVLYGAEWPIGVRACPR